MTGAAALRGRRITFVVDGELDQKTGGYLYDRLVVSGLSEAGVRVDVVSLDRRTVRGAPRNTRAIAELLRPRAACAVVIDELCYPRVLAPLLLARAERPPVVALVHHLTASEQMGIRRTVSLAVERAFVRACDLAIATSETTKSVLRDASVPDRHIRVAPPGRDRLGEAAAPPPPADAARFLFLGALTARKDPLAALDAFAHASRGARLTLVGPDDRDAAYAARVRRAARRFGDRVRVLGEVDDEAVARELRRHDALVMPSRYEGYGIAAAEAQAHGLLVVASRVGGLVEVLSDGDGSLLVPPGDVAALAAALRRAASEPAWLEDQKRRALAHAARLPRWSDTVGAFASALVALLECAHAAR